MKKVALLFLIVLAAVLPANAQQSIFQPGDYKDGVYDKENAVNRRFIPYTHLRQGDVTWEKRVWRNIDMREKMNQPLYFPKEPVVSRTSLMQLIVKHVLSGQIIAFKDEEFQMPMERSEMKELLISKTGPDSVETEQYNEAGEMYYIKVANLGDSTWIYNNFCSLQLKEDWFFDKQKSVLEVRIVGLGFSVLLPGKEELGCNPKFYVYFPACRPYFAQNEVYNTRNDSERRTFEDVFWKRQFTSTVVKESNVYDRKIEDYAKGIDGLLESDRVKQDIFRWEHDLWHF